MTKGSSGDARSSARNGSRGGELLGRGPSPRDTDQADYHNQQLSERLAHDLKTRAFKKGGNVVLLGAFTAQPLGRDPFGATALAYKIYRCR